MISKCEKCCVAITKKNVQCCKGLLCSKIFCNSCIKTELNLCGTCRQTLLCPLCVLVWDICLSCLDNDNAVVNNFEVIRVL